MRFKIVSLIAVMGLVAACGTTPPAETAATSGAGAAHAGHTMAESTENQLYRVGDRVFFGFDQYNLTPTARETLKKQAAFLAANGGARVTIEGHCDERGTREYNLALGERRANAVKDYLMTLGVSADRINTISYGKERPVVAASTDAAWAANRRSQTVLR